MAQYGSLARLVSWRESSLPIAWDQLFGSKAPLKVEIGFGNGDYLVRSALDDPTSHYVGIEMTWGSVWRALRKAEKKQPSNLKILLEDARIALLWSFAEKSITSVTGLFPCPWPKKRHAKHRLFSPVFLQLVNGRLIDGGELVVVTDSFLYRDQMLGELTPEATGFRLTLDTIPASFGTKYERKWRAGGQEEFYRLTFKKFKHFSVEFPEAILVKHQIAKNFRPTDFKPIDQADPYKVLFKAFLYDPVREVGMQEVITHEDCLDQHFWIRIKKSREGWKIAPAAGQALLPLPSVQAAIDSVWAAAEGGLKIES